MGRKRRFWNLWISVFTLAAIACSETRVPTDTGANPVDTGFVIDTGSELSDAGSDPEDAGAIDTGAPDSGPAPLAPGTHEFALATPDGRTRRYFIYVPTSYSGTSATAVVMMLHGGGGAAEGTADSTQMNATAELHEFITVYPEGIPAGGNGINATWNSEICCGAALEQDVDDVTYFNLLLDDLPSHINVDQTRIYATGISNGAMMSYVLGCELSERIAAIAPVAAQLELPNCTAARAVPTFHIHGVEDGCALYDGGPECGGCFQRYLNQLLGTNIPEVTWPCPSVPNAIQSWRTQQGCETETSTTYQNGDATCLTTACGTEGEVTLCSVENMGHTWPGGTHGALCDNPNSRACRLWEGIVGGLNTDISNEQIWAFFQTHTLP